MNIRFTAYDTARAACARPRRPTPPRSSSRSPRSEMSYCELPPAEYSAMIIAAAIKEGYFQPLFIQGDHFQVKAAKYETDPEGAIGSQGSDQEAIPAGFWNIDIDTSTLVTLEPRTLNEQQYHNFTRSAEITEYVRELEPEGVTISLGGEIGEVGEKNSTPEELEAYMQDYAKRAQNWAIRRPEQDQRPDRHQPRRRRAARRLHRKVAVDFDTLGVLGARPRVGAGGAVQHGASTLPDDFFHKFPEVETLEIHLATGFMNIFLDHADFPADLTDKFTSSWTWPRPTSAKPARLTPSSTTRRARRPWARSSPKCGTCQTATTSSIRPWKMSLPSSTSNST